MKKLFYIFLIAGLFLGFASKAEAALNPPTPIFPCDNATTDLYPVLRWNGVSGAWRYYYDLFNLTDDRWVFPRSMPGGTIDTFAAIRVDGSGSPLLRENKNYRWSVASVEYSSRDETWSGPCYFNTNNAQPPPPPSSEPTILNITPNQGPVGIYIGITGRNIACFSRSEQTVIFIGDNGQTLTDNNPTCLSFDVLETNIPVFPSSVRSINIQVQVEGRTSGSFPFTLTSAPVPPVPPGPPGPDGDDFPGISCEGSIIGPGNLKTYFGYRDTNDNGQLDSDEISDANRKTVAYDGLIPCGKCVLVGGPGLIDENGNLDGTPEETKPIYCQFCHFFVMFQGIVNFLLFSLIPPIAVLMFVIAGIMFFTAAGDPAKLGGAKKVITSVVIGLAIIFTAWLIVNTILVFTGLSEFGLGLVGPDKWFRIDCPIKLP